MSIKAGDLIEFLPAWRDAGDDKWIWVAAEDEWDDGRIAIKCINANMFVEPRSVARVEWIVR